ncbi:uncharacterized protein TRUGW13939_11791 [Talaromyces rugulosus]|uniref:PIPK domain-containing protein n=1 Tax=Talaromyces rugulosus TaxID=121627 RepID=A0A7H8REB5_TALRU|nr:uncharacterized protein TRUGW13939_11791 [Talaromyces rugulosus]QKX64616.1 hypothetical protein TRUGW13939_11791 [Talaromyces rugulosus]
MWESHGREKAISRSIHRALTREPYSQGIQSHSWVMCIYNFFSLSYVRLSRVSAELFKHLRNEVWKIDDTDYTNAFRHQGPNTGLVAVGDLGYSGSAFFRTANSRYLAKSLPRSAEHRFFKEELLVPYYEYMKAHTDSLLVHITDLLGVPSPVLGTMVGYAPSHHVIMENIMYDREQSTEPNLWETYDLKPIDYFYPERDLVPEPLTSRAVKSRLYDHFKDKVRVTKTQFQNLRRLLEQDTMFLKSGNTVDYSLFLIRYPAHILSTESLESSSEWSRGVTSTDGKWKYRVVLLDFFWAKHKLPAQAMTGVVQTFNVVGRKGPMSITTTAEEYREKFLQMADGLVELTDDQPECRLAK